jgi:hypothetical protein
MEPQTEVIGRGADPGARKPTAAPPVPAPAEPKRLPPYHLIRLDNSQPRSEIFGDMLPDDPWYGVKYMQDGLPFDALGRLKAPLDGTRFDRFESLNSDGKKCFHDPMWSPERLRKLERKITKMEKARKALAQQRLEDEDDDDDISEDVLRAVNLESWVKGHEQYDDRFVIAAVASRYRRRCANARAALHFLVHDDSDDAPQLVHPRDVDPRLVSRLGRAS